RHAGFVLSLARRLLPLRDGPRRVRRRTLAGAARCLGATDRGRRDPRSRGDVSRHRSRGVGWRVQRALPGPDRGPRRDPAGALPRDRRRGVALDRRSAGHRDSRRQRRARRLCCEPVPRDERRARAGPLLRVRRALPRRDVAGARVAGRPRRHPHLSAEAGLRMRDRHPPVSLAARALGALAPHAFPIGLAAAIFGLVLFVVVLDLLFHARAGSRRALFALPPLVLLWANLHGSYPLGIGLVLAFSLEAVLVRRADAPRFLAALVACIVLSFLDPDTLGIGGAASHAFTPPRFISEEAPPDVLTPAGLIFAAYVLASLGFALVVGGIL